MSIDELKGVVLLFVVHFQPSAILRRLRREELTGFAEDVLDEQTKRPYVQGAKDTYNGGAPTTRSMTAVLNCPMFFDPAPRDCLLLSFLNGCVPHLPTSEHIDLLSKQFSGLPKLKYFRNHIHSNHNFKIKLRHKWHLTATPLKDKYIVFVQRQHVYRH